MLMTHLAPSESTKGGVEAPNCSAPGALWPADYQPPELWCLASRAWAWCALGSSEPLAQSAP